MQRKRPLLSIMANRPLFNSMLSPVAVSIAFSEAMIGTTATVVATATVTGKGPIKKPVPDLDVHIFANATEVESGKTNSNGQYATKISSSTPGTIAVRANVDITSYANAFSNVAYATQTITFYSLSPQAVLNGQPLDLQVAINGVQYSSTDAVLIPGQQNVDVKYPLTYDDDTAVQPAEYQFNPITSNQTITQQYIAPPPTGDCNSYSMSFQDLYADTSKVEGYVASSCNTNSEITIWVTNTNGNILGQENINVPAGDSVEFPPIAISGASSGETLNVFAWYADGAPASGTSTVQVS